MGPLRPVPRRLAGLGVCRLEEEVPRRAGGRGKRCLAAPGRWGSCWVRGASSTANRGTYWWAALPFNGDPECGAVPDQWKMLTRPLPAPPFHPRPRWTRARGPRARPGPAAVGTAALRGHTPAQSILLDVERARLLRGPMPCSLEPASSPRGDTAHPLALLALFNPHLFRVLFFGVFSWTAKRCRNDQQLQAPSRHPRAASPHLAGWPRR